MIDIKVILLLVVLHFVMDVFFQNRVVFKKKTDSEWYLLLHVCIYSIPFFYFGWEFALITGALHYIIDFFTSRMADIWYDNNKELCVIGVKTLDPIAHIVCLVLTYILLQP